MDLDTALRLVLQDVAVSIRPPGLDEVIDFAHQRRAMLERLRWGADVRERFIEDVQQMIHNTRLDTDWPRCPIHTRHPLWIVDMCWTCLSTGQSIVRCGELASLPTGITPDHSG